MSILRILLMTVLTLSLSAPAIAAGGGGEKVESPYVELHPLLLPIITDDGITQQVSLIVMLEVKDALKKPEVEAMQPKIVDAFVAELYGTLDKSNAVTKSGVLRLDLVKRRLQAVSNKILGADTVSDVLLQVVQQHRV